LGELIGDQGPGDGSVMSGVNKTPQGLQPQSQIMHESGPLPKKRGPSSSGTLFRKKENIGCFKKAKRNYFGVCGEKGSYKNVAEDFNGGSRGGKASKLKRRRKEANKT